MIAQQTFRRFASNCICAFIPKREGRRRVKQLFGLYHPSAPQNYYGTRKIHFNDEAQDLILETLKSGKPCLIARFGATEYRTFLEYLSIQAGKSKRFDKKTIRWISDLSGFFPADEKHLNIFCSMLKDVVANADIMAVWFKHTEQQIMDQFCLKADLIALNSFSPVYQPNPWSIYLEGKKVLVIHPFEDSIKAQYKKREVLFKNQSTLPNFELKTIKAVQSLADNKKSLPFKSWFEALDFMNDEINKTDFEVAIIGAGAYGIFLAEHCKRIGKQAIHLAGETQVLFGITGKRWIEQHKSLGEISNEHWIQPLESEKPLGSEKVERGCYW